MGHVIWNIYGIYFGDIKSFTLASKLFLDQKLSLDWDHSDSLALAWFSIIVKANLPMFG